jgi:probable rRNA maturation factor
MNILIQNRQRKYKISEEIKTIVEQVVAVSLSNEKVQDKVELSIVFINNKKIKELNQQYREKNKATDVLSFPMYDPDSIKSALGQVLENTYENILLGDIVISLEKAEEQAKEYGHSFEREIGYLVAHGIFHLLGYDHETEMEKMKMRQKEEETLGSIGLTREVYS